MKILYAIASLEIGGAERLFADLARGLAARGHVCDAVVPAEHRGRAEELPDLAATFGRIHDVPAGDWQAGGPALRGAIRESDLVNLSLLGPEWRRGLAEAAEGRPIVHTVHSLTGWVLWYTHNFYHGEPVAAVATVDRQTAAYVSDLWPGGVPLVRHVPNGIRVEDVPRRQAPPPVDRPLVVSVGRISPWAKHQAMLARVAGRVRRAWSLPCPPPVFRLVGGARPSHRPMEDRLQAVAAAAGGDLEITGLVSPDVVRRHLAAASLFVLTSSTEGSPLSILEAWAAGLPVVATAVGGVPELVLPADGEGPPRGTLVAVDDDGGLARAIVGYLVSRRRSAAAGQAGRAYVEAHHHIEQTVDAYETLYGEVLGR